jgi:hypothetical protein
MPRLPKRDIRALDLNANLRSASPLKCGPSPTNARPFLLGTIIAPVGLNGRRANACPPPERAILLRAERLRSRQQDSFLGMA